MRQIFLILCFLLAIPASATSYWTLPDEMRGASTFTGAQTFDAGATVTSGQTLALDGVTVSGAVDHSGAQTFSGGFANQTIGGTITWSGAHTWGSVGSGVKPIFYIPDSGGTVTEGLIISAAGSQSLIIGGDVSGAVNHIRATTGLDFYSGSDKIIGYTGSAITFSQPVTFSGRFANQTIGGAITWSGEHTFSNTSASESLLVESSSVAAAIAVDSTASGGQKWRLYSQATGSTLGAGHFGIYNVDNNAYVIDLTATSITLNKPVTATVTAADALTLNRTDASAGIKFQFNGSSAGVIEGTGDDGLVFYAYTNGASISEFMRGTGSVITLSKQVTFDPDVDANGSYTFGNEVALFEQGVSGSGAALRVFTDGTNNRIILRSSDVSGTAAPLWINGTSTNNYAKFDNGGITLSQPVNVNAASANAILDLNNTTAASNAAYIRFYDASSLMGWYGATTTNAADFLNSSNARIGYATQAGEWTFGPSTATGTTLTNNGYAKLGEAVDGGGTTPAFAIKYLSGTVGSSPYECTIAHNLSVARIKGAIGGANNTAGGSTLSYQATVNATNVTMQYGTGQESEDCWMYVFYEAI
jgi:hypothetical protein